MSGKQKWKASAGLARLTGAAAETETVKDWTWAAASAASQTIPHLDLTGWWPSCWRDGALEKQKHWHRPREPRDTKTTMNRWYCSNQKKEGLHTAKLILLSIFVLFSSTFLIKIHLLEKQNNEPFHIKSCFWKMDKKGSVYMEYKKKYLSGELGKKLN